MKMRAFVSFVAATVSVVAYADDLPWPSDFERNLTARIAAVTPIPRTGSASGLDYFGVSALASSAFGTSACPFWSFLNWPEMSPAMPFNTEPRGGLIILR